MIGGSCYATARTDDDLSGAARHHRTSRRRTVRKWRRRGQHQGRTGLSSQMGRPISGPLGPLPTGMREAIMHLRRSHPGWGPTTLLAELRVDPRWTDQPLPSRSRIAALLSAEKLTRRYQKHSDLPTPLIQPDGHPA
jgi:hypothetical protein